MTISRFKAAMERELKVIWMAEADITQREAVERLVEEFFSVSFPLQIAICAIQTID